VAVSRRHFLGTVGAGGAGLLSAPLISARGREALWGFPGTPAPQGIQGLAERQAARRFAAKAAVRIDSNENPVGPGARALEAIRAHLDESNRYPILAEDDVIAAIARLQGVSANNVILGCGSGELLRVADQAFTSRTAAFVGAAPTFEAPGEFAQFLGTEVKMVPVDGKLGLDLGAMGAAARGAGLVYICNPNNPTATVHTQADVAAFVAAVNRASPDTTILVDEAYFDYVDAPGYGTLIPLALENPRVVVLRTFSKAYGMAGLRLGYGIARPETLARMKPWVLGSNVSQLTLVAARESLGDQAHIAAEVKRNREVKAYTRKFFADAGYTMTSGDANFMMVDIRQNAADFKKAALAKGIAVGRAFVPLTNHSRITFGTMDEMKKATAVFRELLDTHVSGG
jgi:histidinol-phosphate aminotransferase